MRWTTREIRYLEEHAQDGAESIALALGRSTESVRWQASQYGISLRRKWHCPKCGHWVHKPLNGRTGWCAACSKAQRRERLEQEVAELREEVRREQEEDKKRQALYSQKNRLKKSCRKQTNLKETTSDPERSSE